MVHARLGLSGPLSPPSMTLGGATTPPDLGAVGVRDVGRGQRQGAPVGLGLASRAPSLGEARRTPSDPRLVLDPNRTQVDAAQLAERAGAPAAELYLRLAGTPPTTLAALGRAVARALFGPRAGQPIRYAELTRTFEAAGGRAVLDALLSRLPRELLGRVRAGTATPQELLHAEVRRLASLEAAPKSARWDDIASELVRLGRGGEVARVEGLLAPDDLARARRGDLAPREIFALADQAARRDVDVLVVGGGLAGLSAANRVLDAGRSAVVLEAKPRLGGRMFAVSTPSGAVVDMGAAWLHGAAENPLSPIASELGFVKVTDEGRGLVFGTDVPPKVAAERLDDRVAALDERLRAVGRRFDVEARRVVGAPRDALDRAAELALGPLSAGVEFERMSAKDFATVVAEDDDQLVKDGFGRIAEALGHGVPVELEARVEKIRWSTGGVEVTANGEVFRARSVVLTVSTGVLAAGHIEFDPPLPASKLEAIRALPMGHLEKVVLELAPGALRGIEPTTHVRDVADDRAFEMVVRPHGEDVIVTLLGGDLAAELARADEAAAIDLVKGRVADLLGAAVAAKITGASATAWTTDEGVLGAYSAARPGQHSLRAELARPLDGVLFFAGEACADKWAQCAPGAYETGIAAGAEAIHGLLRDERRAS